MNKRIYIIILFTLIVLVGAFLYIKFTATDLIPDKTQPTQQSPSYGFQLGQQSTSIDLKTTNGTMTVRNFLQDSLTKADPVNEGHYQLGNYIDPSVDAPPKVPYLIEYIASTQYFIIVLYEEPIAETRKEAERFLMQYLGIGKEELCQLKYMVSVPNQVNSYYAGQSLGFSFCKGSVPL